MAYFYGLLVVSFLVGCQGLKHLGDSKLYISGKEISSNIVVFMQVTDIHLTDHGHSNRLKSFQRFCKEYVPTINPDIVLVTGDLVDSKSAGHFSSEVSLKQWQMYHEIITKTSVMQRTSWLDITGNHDVFGVPEINSSLDYFRDFSAHGNPRTFVHNLKKSFGTYSFIAIDNCPVPGPHWPLNFFGFVRKETWDQAERLALSTRKSNHTFWFGHYPTSTIVSPEGDIRQLFASTGFAYFCGHLHTFYNILTQLYHLHFNRFWELELGDWRNNRYFRLIAIDDDLVSFVDHRINPMSSKDLDWPLAIVTNPKDSRFLLPSKEPWHRIGSSSHIRILAWSRRPVSRVDVTIDRKYLGKAAQTVDASNSKSPLFVLPWNPQSYADGSVHTIRVVVNDSDGNSRVLTQPFTIGSEAPRFSTFRSYLALVSNHAYNAQSIFYVSWSISFLHFMLPRVTMCCCGKFPFPCRYTRGLKYVVKKYRILGLIVFYHLYMLCGPIFMGFLLDDYFGAVFSFGLFVAGVFVPEAFTYVFEIVQLAIFWLMMPFYLYYCNKRNNEAGSISSQSVNLTIEPHSPAYSARHSRLKFLTSMPIGLFIPLVLFSIIQFIFALLTVWIPYGLSSVILSPGRILPIILFWYLCIKRWSSFEI